MSEWPTTSDLKPHLNQFGGSHHRRARNDQIQESQNISGDYRMKYGRGNLRLAASWVRLRAQSHAGFRFRMTIWPEIEPRYDTNYAVLLVTVMRLRETLVVRE